VIRCRHGGFAVRPFYSQSGFVSLFIARRFRYRAPELFGDAWYHTLSASTAYGYIQQGEPLKGEFNYPVYRVKGFKEKPNEKTAHEFLRSGGYSWNSGMFVWQVGTILSEIEKQNACTLFCAGGDFVGLGNPKQNEVLRAHWRTLKSETIDYGIMERAEMSLCCRPAAWAGTMSARGTRSSMFSFPI